MSEPRRPRLSIREIRPGEEIRRPEYDARTLAAAAVLEDIGLKVRATLLAAQQESCIGAGALGSHIAQRLGVPGIVPVPVAVFAADPLTMWAFDSGRRDWLEKGTVVVVGDRANQPVDPAVDSSDIDQWAGHIILVHRPTGLFVDPTCGQFNRLSAGQLTPDFLLGRLPEPAAADTPHFSLYHPFGHGAAAIGYLETPGNTTGLALVAQAMPLVVEVGDAIAAALIERGPARLMSRILEADGEMPAAPVLAFGAHVRDAHRRLRALATKLLSEHPDQGADSPGAAPGPAATRRGDAQATAEHLPRPGPHCIS